MLRLESSSLRALAAWLRPRRELEPRLAVALQGGGSLGAFTWGVLDRLLEEETPALDAVSGASAGAVNAVVLAAGLAEGGRKAARERLDRVWRRISEAALFTPGRHGLGAVGSAALEFFLSFLSPYQLNPLGLNPLREILAAEVDFARLRTSAPVELLVAATRVRDGRPRIFRRDELTLDAVLASACLPLLHHAIEIAGEWYWDGGYSANPPLRDLLRATAAKDVLVVQIIPEAHEPVPTTARAIAHRASQIAFSAPLRSEVEALAELAALARCQRLFPSALARRFRRLQVHRIAAEDSVDGLADADAMAADWPFLSRLKAAGRAAAETWLVSRGPALRP